MATFYFHNDEYTADEIREMSAEDFERIREYWDAIANFMEHDAREASHSAVAPCTEQEFLVDYLRRADEDLYFN